MGMEAMIARQVDSELYRVGEPTTMRRAIRRYQSKPRLEQGQKVTIRRLDFVDRGGYTLHPRVEIETEDGQRRWIDAVDVLTNGRASV